jgi:integrase
VPGRQGKERARHFARKVDAQRWIDEVTASVVTGKYVDPNAGRVTFARTSRTIARVRCGPRDIGRQAGGSVTFVNVPLKAIRPSHVQQWVKVMSLAAQSRQGVWRPARSALGSTTYTWRSVPRLRIDSSSRSPRPGCPYRRFVALGGDDYPDARRDVGGARSCSENFRTFVAVCAFPGLRLGEAAGLRLDVDFLRRSITVRRQVQGKRWKDLEVCPPKHGSERVVYVPQELVAILSEHVRRQGTLGEEQWLFSASGHLWNRNSAGNQWRRARDASGITDFTLHDCRHFLASGLIASD